MSKVTSLFSVLPLLLLPATTIADVTWDEQVPLAPGVIWSRTVMTDLPMGGNQTVNVVEVDLKTPQVEIRPILQPVPGICQPLSEMSDGALASVNGGFFHYDDGNPCTSINIVRIDNEQLYDNIDNRTALGIDQDGNFHIEEIQAYEQWNNMLHALGGGPNLVTNGQVDISPIQEGFGLDISGKNPRTAVCLVGSDYDKFLMITVDGRTEEGAGMALAGEAELLIRLGCYDGMNLDGGGSTTMWTSLFGIMNTPSDGEERDIPTALGIYLL